MSHCTSQHRSYEASCTVQAHCLLRPNVPKRISKQTNSVAWVRERTIPTEGPPLVGEVSANLCV
jgi:hypothetical protein